MFLQRLEARSEISAQEREAVLSLNGQPQKVAAHRDFVRLGEELEDSCLIVDGLVARFSQLEDGSRQIVSLHVPGDMVDLYSLMLPKAPSPLQALTNVTIIKVPHRLLRELAFDHRGLASAFWRDCVVDGAIVAQWLVNVGRRNARGRIAHLICELAVRYAQIGALTHGRFPFPITQEQLGDALGLTSVHVNRSIKTLREDGLITVTRGTATILDWAGLVSVAEFNPAYLHLPISLGENGLAAVRQVR
ncbi:Crp/Fnr family transcriptional regulator [Sphingomonas sp. IC4-52]|uniref:Crp/Fnr family transcriptional regulator n=1 Tax=Sphingomonas sp. IC4-52 TaxID=2887202 RepID=UPI001D1240FB|nr:Crp/Fnr family transcriptional regulator [Sphingomonas sp. IC4-52]MCC2978810.1 Crp/Fnr family transcriptional regulator [Sphingomonas sp. IC4-52]